MVQALRITGTSRRARTNRAGATPWCAWKVPNLQATFAENWLESTGELIAGPDYFPIIHHDRAQTAMIVNSMPSMGGSTRARVLMQSLIASAHKSILITTPYFLPGQSLQEEIVRARQRGCAGEDHYPGQEKRSRGDAQFEPALVMESRLQAGAQIYEYQPAMIHAKILIVDGCGVWWAPRTSITAHSGLTTK